MTHSFQPVLQHVLNTHNNLGSSGAALYILHNGKPVLEHYFGSHSPHSNSRLIQPDSQFHVASVRKGYIAFAAAFAIQRGLISSVDDPVTAYLPNTTLPPDVSIRHLLTHTHGLRVQNGKLTQEFSPGENWAYRGIGVKLLIKLIQQVTGRTVADILATHVLDPAELLETGWYGSSHERLVEVVRDADDPNWYTSESEAGDEMNMYVSARDLARFGQLHLKGSRELDEVFQVATSFHSPTTLPGNKPRQGFLWFLPSDADRSELSEHMPPHSFQLLGYTNVTLLVVPEHQIVAVRAFNRFGSPEGFNYLEDVRSFGHSVLSCVAQ